MSLVRAHRCMGSFANIDDKERDAFVGDVTTLGGHVLVGSVEDAPNVVIEVEVVVVIVYMRNGIVYVPWHFGKFSVEFINCGDEYLDVILFV